MELLNLFLWILALLPLAISDWRFKQTHLISWSWLIILVNANLIKNGDAASIFVTLLLFNTSHILLSLLPNKSFLGLGLADYRLLISAIFYFNWPTVAIYLLVSCLLILAQAIYTSLKTRKDAHKPTVRASTYPLLTYFCLANFLDFIYHLSLLII